MKSDKSDLFEKICLLLELDQTCDCKVLDIGCGQGELLGTLSKSIKTEPCLIGIDENKRAIEVAQQSLPNLEFHCEKFTDTLSFADDSFDAVVSVDTLECIPNKTELIDEIHRVLKPNGRVVFAHWDWDTQVYNSVNIPIIRKLVAAFSDWQQDWMETSDGQMGRRLRGLFEVSGKFKGNIVSFTLIETEFREGRYGYDRLSDLSELVGNGVIDPSEYEMICNEMKALSNTKEYFYSLNSYIYSGQPS